MDGYTSAVGPNVSDWDYYDMEFNDSAANVSRNSCAFIDMPYLESKFYLVCVFGNIVAAFAIVGNVILIYVFSRRPYFRRSHFLYFTAMAVADLLISMLYIIQLSISIVFEYTVDMDLMRTWYSYCLPLYLLSNIVLMVSPYLLVAASLERYLINQWVPITCTKRKRSAVIFGVVLFSVLSKGTVWFELKVTQEPNCTNLAALKLEATKLRLDPAYDAVWCFWYRNMVSVFLPFAVLCYVNFRMGMAEYCKCPIPAKLRRFMQIFSRPKFIRFKRRPYQASTYSALSGKVLSARSSASLLTWAQRAKARVRKGNVRTVIVIVIEYLICNALSFVVTAWEHIDSVGLIRNHFNFYLFATDVISILVIFSCAIRLPTYLVCDITFRRELLFTLCSKKEPKRRPSLQQRRASSHFSMNTFRNNAENGAVVNGPGFSSVVMLALERKRQLENLRNRSIEVPI